MMIKNILYLSFLAAATTAQAQISTTNPTSFYGIGMEKKQNTNEINQMGGLGVFADSLHINLANPATVTHIQRATFSMGASGRISNFSDTSANKTNSFTGEVDYINFAFPIEKFAVSIGLSPFANTGYKLKSNYTDNNFEIDNEFYGKGNINRTFIGLSYLLHENWSVGVDVSYLFGDILHETTKFIKDTDSSFPSYNGSQYAENSAYSGFRYNMGVHFLKNIKNNKQLYASATYSPLYQLNRNYTADVSSIRKGSNNSIVTEETKNVTSTKDHISLAQQYSVGLGYGQKNKWFIGGEYIGKNTSIQNNAFTYHNAQFENSYAVSVGGYYTPRYNSFTSYLQRMSYRMGISHEKTGLMIENQSIVDNILHLGLGFPVGHYASNFNIGFDFGQRGNNTPLKENYIIFSVGFSFNDIWFEKRKFQ